MEHAILPHLNRPWSQKNISAFYYMLLDRGVGGPPDIGNEIAEMIGFPESVAKHAGWCARFFLGTFPGTGSTGTRSSHRDLQNDVP